MAGAPGLSGRAPGRAVSCIVPAHDSAAHIGEALDSILAQTHAPHEVIVVDDGSSDGTGALAVARGAPVRVVRLEDEGPAAARNRGLREAGGDLVAFLDADDLWHPEKLERQLSQLDADPSLDGSVTHVRMFWSGASEAEEERYREHPRAGPVPGYATTTLLARRDLFERVGELDPSLWFSDATDWFVRARERGARIGLHPDVLTYHRMHPSNLTRRREQASRAEFLEIARRSLRRRREAAG